MESERGLGRLPPTDDRHLRRWSLTAETMPVLPTPVVLGINWYAGFSRDKLVERNGVYAIPSQGVWSSVRGGHAICVRPPSVRDRVEWWQYYDQGKEGACVGFSSSRMMTLLNRDRYDGRRLYLHAQRVDEWPGEDYSGTSVRAGMDVLRNWGAYLRTGVQSYNDGIFANRWAVSVEEIAGCLSPSDGGAYVLNAGYVQLVNSWGVYYPHYVRLDLEGLERLVFREEGEATVVTDR